MLLVTIAASSAAAVVVSTTQETTTRPPADFGWDNVGILRNATAIYLGDRWVLSAAHLGAGSVAFPTVGTFTADLATVYQLTNLPGSGLTKPADLILFQLTQDPGLPPIDVASVTPSVGTEVWVVGHGLDADDKYTYWDVTQRGTTWTWKETSPPGDYSGIKTVGPGLMRWGTNLIENDETFNNDFDDDILTKLVNSTTETLSILTEFDDDASNSDDDVLTDGGSSATGYESQAVLSDSGGGLFVRDGGRWKLAGTILSVEGHRNQPDVTRNAIFGNLTYYGDLATYAEQIRSRVRFGDLDGDQLLTVADVDALIGAINHDEQNRQFDLDHDGSVGSGDLELWVNDVYYTYPGDANLDGLFDTGDLILVLQAGGYEDDVPFNATWASGDWDGDQEFTTRDFVVALQAGGFEAGPRSDAARPADVAPVPEPSAWLLTALGLWSLTAAVRLRRTA
jgi:hypothetical protein